MNKKVKQILAILAIIMLVGLYIATFIFALMDSPNSGRLFQACLFATIGVPILLWIYIWGYGLLIKKKNMTLFFPDTPPESNTDTAANSADSKE